MKKVYIFDFSGTLSLEAVKFGKNLQINLGESGLGKFFTEKEYWEIIGETWEKLSRLRKALQETISEKLIQEGKIGFESSLKQFIDKYFYSEIDSRWKIVFMEILKNPEAKIVVATDNYSEATNGIISAFQKIGLNATVFNEAQPIKKDSLTNEENRIFVLNSADCGFLKSEKGFWEVLKNKLGITGEVEIVLVDDFGRNEAEGDLYRGKFETRAMKTEAFMKEIFENVKVVRFFPNENGELDFEEVWNEIFCESKDGKDL